MGVLGNLIKHFFFTTKVNKIPNKQTNTPFYLTLCNLRIENITFYHYFNEYP